MPGLLDWHKRPVCVTGGTGFLGYHLVQALRRVGARVRVFGLSPSQGHPLLGDPDVALYVGDVRDPDDVAAAVRDCEVVFHAAGPVITWGPAAQQMIEIHREGTRQVLAAAVDAVIVHVSSIVTIGGTRGEAPLDETTPFDEELLAIDYVRAKREAELLALAAAAAGRHVVVVNPGYLFGPGDYERSVMGKLCRRFWKGQLLVHPTNGINAVDVRDAALGHLLAADHGRPGERYVLGGVNVAYQTLVKHLADAGDVRPRALVPMPNWAQHGLAYVGELRAAFTGREPLASQQMARLHSLNWFVSSEKARAELGFEARPLTRTLRDACRWWREQEGEGMSLNRMTRWWMRAARMRA